MSLKKYIVRTGHSFRRDDGVIVGPGETIELDTGVAAANTERCYPAPEAVAPVAVAVAAAAKAPAVAAAPVVAAAAPAVK